MDKLAELFSDARRIVGFSMNRYDIPVLNNYFQRLPGAPKLWEMERVDLLEEIEMATGQRISLTGSRAQTLVFIRPILVPKRHTLSRWQNRRTQGILHK